MSKTTFQFQDFFIFCFPQICSDSLMWMERMKFDLKRKRKKKYNMLYLSAPPPPPPPPSLHSDKNIQLILEKKNNVFLFPLLIIKTEEFGLVCQ